MTAISMALCAALVASAQDSAGAGEAGEAGAEKAGLPAISPALPQEAPSSLFKVENGADVELMLAGSWKASLSSNPVLSFGSLGTSYGFSGSPLLFRQSPDLLLDLVANGSWFLEAAISDSLADSSFALGYKGKENEAIKEIRAGNKGLSFPSRPFLDFGSSGNKSFGASASIASPGGRKPGFAAQAILRLDSMTPQKTVYIGWEKVTETALRADDYIRGRFFFLPDADIEGVTAYLRTPSGVPGSGGFSYTRLDPSAYSYSASRGSIDFASPLAERCLVAYRRRDGLPISGADTVDGMPAALVYDPGILIGTESLSRYALPDDDALKGAVELSIESSRDGFLDGSFGARVLEEEKAIEVYKRSLAPSERPLLERRPFDALAPETYRPGSLPEGGSPIRILLTTRTRKERLEIDPKAIADTIRVYRDGMRDVNFVYAPGSGYLDLARPPGASERIEIEYMSSAEAFSEDFVAGIGFDFPLAEGLSLYAALGTRWSLPGGKVSVPDKLTAGYLGASSGLSWESEAWNASLDLGAKYSRQDANDACRIDGMEDFLHTQKASGGIYKRSVLPAGRAEGERAALYYRDYERIDVFGNRSYASLESGYIPGAADPNAKQGPYLAGDGTFGTAAVAEFSLDSSRNWCAVQARLDPGLLEKLPQASAIVVPIRYLHGSGLAPAFSLSAGMLGKSPDDPSTEGSDLPDARFAIDAGAISPPAESWTEYEIPLNGVANRAAAAGMREGASLLLIISSSAPSRGRCIIGDIRLKGAAYLKGVDAASTNFLSLEQLYTDGPETAFAAETQKWRESTTGNAYLRLSVQGNLGRDAVSASKEFPVLPISAYTSISFFARWSMASATNPSLVLRLRDSSGLFLVASIPLGASSPWCRAEIDLDSGKARLRYPEGENLDFPVSLLRAPLSQGAWLEWSLEGVESGFADLDEAGLSDSRATFTGQAAFSLEMKKTGSLLSIAGLDAISGAAASLSGQFGVSNSGFDYAAQAKAGVFLFPFGLEAATSMAGRAGTGQAASWPSFLTKHRIFLPFPGGELGSSFSQNSATGDFEQSEEAGFAYGKLSLSGQASAAQSVKALSQSWKAGFGAEVLGESLGTSIALSNELFQANPLAGNLYPGAWLGSYAYLLPHSSSADGSKRSTSLTLAALSAREGFAKNEDFSFLASALYAAGNPDLQGSKTRFSLSPLLKIGKAGSLRLLPRYARSSLLSLPGISEGFPDDAELLFSSLGYLPSIWRAIPLAELFDGRALAELRSLAFDPQTAQLEATAGIGMERDASWGLWELFLPSQVSYALTRSSQRKGSVVTEALVHEASLAIHAIDLFGKTGIRPLGLPFETDEYGMEQKLKLSQAIVGVNPAYQYSASFSALFGLRGRDKLDLKDELRLGSAEERFADSFAASLILAKSASPGLEAARAALLVWLKGKERPDGLKSSSPLAESWLGDEMIQSSAFGLGAAASLSDTGLFSLSLPLSYESALSVEPSFRLSAGGKLAFGWRKSASYSQFDLGLTLTLQARFEF